MSKYYDVALAIDARDYDIVIRDIRKITPTPMELFTSTPDNDYIIFFWEYVLWEGADVNSLLHTIETLRHALYSISEDHEVWKDVEVSDSWGTDEQFYELLDVSAKLKLWDDRCNLASLRNVDAIEWAGDSEGEDLSFLPESVLIPENIPDDGIADYLSDRYGFLVASYSITSDCGKWFYAEIEGIDEDFQKITLTVVVCDQCNTFYPVAYAGAGHRYCPNCGKRMAPAEEGGVVL